jgi:hypothetical protein
MILAFRPLQILVKRPPSIGNVVRDNNHVVLLLPHLLVALIQAQRRDANRIAQGQGRREPGELG